jgi:hypothetical protein
MVPHNSKAMPTIKAAIFNTFFMLVGLYGCINKGSVRPETACTLFFVLCFLPLFLSRKGIKKGPQRKESL